MNRRGEKGLGKRTKKGGTLEDAQIKRVKPRGGVIQEVSLEEMRGSRIFLWQPEHEDERKQRGSNSPRLAKKNRGLTGSR